MKKPRIVLLLAMFLFSGVAAMAQIPPATPRAPKPKPQQKKSYTVVIPAKYYLAENFSEGLAAVKINGKWGFIDKTGKMVIPATFSGAKDFSEGLAAVEINGKWGYIRYDN